MGDDDVDVGFADDVDAHLGLGGTGSGVDDFGGVWPWGAVYLVPDGGEEGLGGFGVGV